eukprot:187048_1
MRIKNNKLVCGLLISNMVSCTLLFWECMLKFNDVSMDSNTHIFPIELTLMDDHDDIIEDMIHWALKPYSICYIFNKNKDINSENRIALVTVSDLTSYPHPKSWLPLSRMNRLQYAYNFSYDYCDFPRDFDFTTLREIRWVKFGALYTVLKHYKYVVWLDTDTLFWNRQHIPFNKHALQWFHKYTNLSILFSDHGNKPVINAGIFILKHTQFSFNFLETIYVDYVNTELTKHHADQDAFQDFMAKYNEYNEIMVVPSEHLQKIYMQARPHLVEDDYKQLYSKQYNTIILHRASGAEKKYFQMNDIVKDWMDDDVLTRMKALCGSCFEDNTTWHDAVKGVSMNEFRKQKGNQVIHWPTKKMKTETRKDLKQPSKHYTH